VASTLNAVGARLCHSTNTVSSSKLAGQFMDEFRNEADSMKPQKAINCVLHQQDKFPNGQHHHKVFGFPFSQHLCPRETQLVVSLFKTLLSQKYGNVLDIGGELNLTLSKPKVGVLCHNIALRI
jgi:hypothetical protein